MHRGVMSGRGRAGVEPLEITEETAEKIEQDPITQTFSGLSSLFRQ